MSNVFDQPDPDAEQERAQRIKRMLIAGGATAAVVGGGVAAAGALKGDDSLSFPDESSDKEIDRAIHDADSKAAHHEPAVPSAPHVAGPVAAAPAEHAAEPASAHMGPSELADVKEVTGEVVDTSAPADPAAPAAAAAAAPVAPPVAPPVTPVPGAGVQPPAAGGATVNPPPTGGAAPAAGGSGQVPADAATMHID